jgi:rubredoxin
MSVTALLKKSVLKRNECSRCGSEYRRGNTYRGMPVCGICARTLSAQIDRS